MDKILVCDHFTTESLEFLRHSWNCEIIRTSPSPAESELAVATGLLIRSKTEVNATLLAKAPHLKAVVTATSGYNHIHTDLCRERNIKAMYTPDANTQSAAELTVFLMLSILRKIGFVNKALRSNSWKEACPNGSELKNKTVGIIGLGRVGSKVVEFLKPFGCEIIAHDPYQSDEKFERLGLARSGLTEVLVQAQILSLHVPLTAETRHLINGQTLSIAQQGMILINTSRGSVVDERALLNALETEQILAAGLDVFEHEPLISDSKLKRYPQVILTPHIGAHTDEAYALASKMAVDRLIDYLKNGKIADAIPL